MTGMSGHSVKRSREWREARGKEADHMCIGRGSVGCQIDQAVQDGGKAREEGGKGAVNKDGEKAFRHNAACDAVMLVVQVTQRQTGLSRCYTAGSWCGPAPSTARYNPNPDQA